MDDSRLVPMALACAAVSCAVLAGCTQGASTSATNSLGRSPATTTAKYPALVGTYVFADYIKGWVAGIRVTAPDGTALRAPQERTLLQTGGHPSSFGLDEAGELYLVDYSGTVSAVRGTAR